MKPFLGIKVLIKCRAIELNKPVQIIRKVRRRPIKDHTEPFGMGRFNETCKLRRRTIARCRRINPKWLITPRWIVGMLHHRQQLDMRKAHLSGVIDQFNG